MKKNHLIALCLLLFSTIIIVQKSSNLLEEDIKYEIYHKNQPWFTGMKDGANYFEIKNKYDTFFGNHKWEKSKPRALGESWIKSKLFYLDNNGIVQAEPQFKASTKFNKTLNTLSSNSTTINGTWSLLGPVNSATTGYSGRGNHGGYVYMNRIDPTNTQKMFVSFVTGGLWMTIDGGTNWTLVDTNMPDNTYIDLDVAISNPLIVYAISKNQVIKSVDGGLNWISTSLTNSTYSSKFYDIAVSPANENIVLARIGDKIYRTIDGGTNWVSVISGLRNHTYWDSSSHSEFLEWNSSNPNIVYSVSTNHNNEVKVHLSNDAGLSFSEVSTITLDAAANGQTVGYAKILTPTSNTNSFYVAVGSGDNSYAHKAIHLYKLNTLTGAVESVKTNMVSGISRTQMHHGDISMDKTNENLIVYGTYGQDIVHISTDNGVTFIESVGKTHSDIRTIDIVNNRILVGSDGESVISIDNGTTLTTLTNSISNHELWGFGSAFKTDLVATGNNHGPSMIKEAGNGFDWYNASGADQGNTDVNPLDDRYIYANGYDTYRYFRTGVHTFENQSNRLNLGGYYAYFNSIEFHPNNYYTIITHHNGFGSSDPTTNTWKKSLIKTEDNGNSISIVKTFDNQVFREKISMKNPNHMYVVEGLTNNNLWHTADEGATWTNITPSSTASVGQTNISDIAVGDENPNEIWVTYSGVQDACKVLKSNDYGATWTNLTQPNLSTHPLTKIVFQRGSNGGVYVGNKSGVYYKNNTMPNWVLLGNGLPMCEIRFMFINYNQGKLKIGTSRGAFSHDLYETSPVNALISASTAKITCPTTEKVQFKDYSVVRNASATWSWSFPGGTPATSTEENPEISYENAADGKYSVSLTVTDATGTSSQTLTDFIEIINQCGTSIPETIPGNVATISKTTSDYLELNDLNINKNSFTFSCWIKPNGIQGDATPIFMSQNDSKAFALNFHGSDNTLGFHPTWRWSSGLQAPPNEWSHVALVSNGTNVKIYVNGVESTNSTAISSEIISTLNLGRYGRGRTDRYTNIELDEVSIWNRPLSKDEIRQWRHLTKSTAGASILTGLVSYFQFNEAIGNISVNKTANANYIIYKGASGNTHAASTAPVFGGVAEKLVVNSSGEKNFSTVDTSINFSGTNPNGDVWVTKSTINPDNLPDANTAFDTYYVINNYGANKIFDALSSIKFANTNFTSTTASSYNLYKRENNAFGNTWGSILDTGDLVNTIAGPKNQITFSTGLNVTSFSQFVLTNSGIALSVDTESLDNIPQIYPTPVERGNPLSIKLPNTWVNSTMVIYDNLGRKITNTSLKKTNQSVILNIGSGIYNIIIYKGSKKFHHKIIIN